MLEDQRPAVVDPIGARTLEHVDRAAEAQDRQVEPPGVDSLSRLRDRGASWLIQLERGQLERRG
jgi:hypothetical protein